MFYMGQKSIQVNHQINSALAAITTFKFYLINKYFIPRNVSGTFSLIYRGSYSVSKVLRNILSPEIYLFILFRQKICLSSSKSAIKFLKILYIIKFFRIPICIPFNFCKFFSFLFRDINFPVTI